MNDHERIQKEHEEIARNMVRVIWEAYLSIRNGGIYEISDAKMYKTVRPRLKRRLAVFRPTDDTLIDRFRLVK